MSLRDLYEGMSGADVRAVQEGLNVYFHGTRNPLDPDGSFGPETLAAVAAFQRLNPGTGNPDGTPDGIVGRATRRKLFPLGILTVDVFGYRLGMPWSAPRGIQPPNLGPGPLQPPGTPPAGYTPNPNANTLRIDWSKVPWSPSTPNSNTTLDVRWDKIVADWRDSVTGSIFDYKPTLFRGLSQPIAAPNTPLYTIPDLPSNPPLQAGPALASPDDPLALPTPDHFELSPNSQFTVGPKFPAWYVLSLQAVFVIGDDQGAHLEPAFGFMPNLDPNGKFRGAYYAQLTDVDRFGAIGHFHWWQPFAQVLTDGRIITGSIVPVNLQYDVNDKLSISILQLGTAATYDTASGVISRPGITGSTGIIFKFGGK